MKLLKLSRWGWLLLLSYFTVPAVASCPGTSVTVDLTSPSGAGTYSTPLRFTASASSSYTITGYAVYTDSWSNIPFAAGQPVYLNAKSTLDAWVVLPLTSTGGALAQNVFVRAWDAQGDCGDSATLAITASGAVVPSAYPAGYQQWLNRDDDTTENQYGPGWWPCGTSTDPCAGGTNPANSATIAFGQSPTKDGTGSALFTIQGPPSSDALFYYKIPPLGEQDTMQNFVWDFWFQVSSDTATDGQAMEFDLFQALPITVGGQEKEYWFMIGTQCDYAHGVWDAWDQTSGHWIPAIRNTQTDQNPQGTAIPCSKFSTSTWHHAQFFLQRTYPDSTYPEGRILYGTVKIDTTTTEWNISAPAVVAPSGYTDVLGFQHQLDINASAPNPTTMQEWADEDDLTAWPQD
jgi:hypothetical protein